MMTVERFRLLVEIGLPGGIKLSKENADQLLADIDSRVNDAAIADEMGGRDMMRFAR